MRLWGRFSAAEAVENIMSEQVDERMRELRKIYEHALSLKDGNEKSDLMAQFNESIRQILLEMGARIEQLEKKLSRHDQ